jgi:hypothetical protein
LRQKQRDPRFKKVMGRLVAAKLLTTNLEGIRPHDKPVPLEDALWAGTVEPRITELLPDPSRQAAPELSRRGT